MASGWNITARNKTYLFFQLPRFSLTCYGLLKWFNLFHTLICFSDELNKTKRPTNPSLLNFQNWNSLAVGKLGHLVKYSFSAEEALIIKLVRLRQFKESQRHLPTLMVETENVDIWTPWVIYVVLNIRFQRIPFRVIPLAYRSIACRNVCQHNAGMKQKTCAYHETACRTDCSKFNTHKHTETLDE